MRGLHNRPTQRVWISAIVTLLCILLSIGIIAKKYEMRATQNRVVNTVKRLTADFLNIAFQIYDPYQSSIQKTQTGSLNANLAKTALSTKDELKIFLKKYCSNCEVIEYVNPDLVRSRYAFQYENYLNRNLLELKYKYHLDDVVKGAKTEFDKQMLLGQWINRQWNYGDPKNIDYNFNSLDVIDRGRRGEMFSCSEYSIAFVQAALSLGFQARYVGLTQAGQLRGHAVSEVWSTDFDKWYVIDNSFNFIYTVHAIPLNAYEIHSLWCNHKWKDIKVITTKAPREKSDINIGFIDYYQSFFIRMRNDWYSNILPHWHPLSNSISNGVEYMDSCSEDSVLMIHKTSHVSDLYWSINKVHIYLWAEDKTNPLTFQVYIDTETPNFNEFVIRSNKKTMLSKSNIFQWVLKEGINTLAVAASNSLGNVGPFSTLTIQYGASH